MTIENYFERRIRPISEDIKSPTNISSSSNNLIDEDQLARTFQEIVNCINLDDDDVQLSDARTLNNFHSHHPLLPEYESIFGGTKGSFNVTVGSKSSSTTTVNSVVGKSFLDDDWFPNTNTQVQSNTNNTSNSSSSSSNYSSNVNTNSASLVRPPGYPMINRPITPSSTASSSSSSFAFNRAFNNHPPSDYVCKLCNCDGHWMKDCKLYEPRSPTSSISSGSSSNFKNGNVQQQQHHQGFNNNNTPNSNNRTFLPPGNYVCRLCNVSGHWIDQCSKFQPKHLETENGSGGSFSNSAPVLPPMLGSGPTPNYRPPAYLSKPVPSNYICNLCNRSGHWIQQCTEFTPIINHKRQ